MLYKQDADEYKEVERKIIAANLADDETRLDELYEEREELHEVHFTPGFYDSVSTLKSYYLALKPSRRYSSSEGFLRSLESTKDTWAV